MDKIDTPPKKPPRVSVPLDAEVLQVFQRLAKVANMSTGRAVAEWLRDTLEAAQLMASTLERARAAPKIVTAELHAMMLGMADQTKGLQDQFARFKGSLSDGPQTLSPPSSNTGGKVPRENPKLRGKG